ncbi:hypothetical protein [Pseudarthrobacter enclensis]|uniref:Uncharacterized protein n=1 Tax=Pseudarthrobacter enclensis TaxID=993070 RepID=A0ABT9S1D6_9MICC|nr:hypothetical protein [Pseudarthrobacter enclensis]MDP9890815.1 hypothetical protein [Pseudarthrobacter enclensis]
MTADEPVPSFQGGISYSVVTEDPRTLQEELAAAVELVRGRAGQQGRSGILITRRSRSLFTVELDDGVPYGTTMEQDRWQRGGSARPGSKDIWGE